MRKKLKIIGILLFVIIIMIIISIIPIKASTTIDAYEARMYTRPSSDGDEEGNNMNLWFLNVTPNTTVGTVEYGTWVPLLCVDAPVGSGPLLTHLTAIREPMEITEPWTAQVLGMLMKEYEDAQEQYRGGANNTEQIQELNRAMKYVIHDVFDHGGQNDEVGALDYLENRSYKTGRI